MEKLHRHRRTVERRLGRLQTSLDREVGLAPVGSVWVVPLMAFAGGLALAGILGTAMRPPRGRP